MIYGGRQDNSLQDLEYYVNQTVSRLRFHDDEFDFIACSGMSGVVVAAPAALKLGKPVVIVRKPEDRNNHHRGGEIIGHDDAYGRYVILDDFVSMGHTVQYIEDKLAQSRYWPVHAASYMYEHDSYYAVKPPPPPAPEEQYWPTDVMTAEGLVDWARDKLNPPVKFYPLDVV